MTVWSNQSPEPTPGGAGRSAVAVHGFRFGGGSAFFVRPQHTFTMNRFARAWKAAVKGYKEGTVPDHLPPSEYQGGGHRIRCPQCGNERFMERPAPFSLSTLLTCERCGLEQRYGKKPEKLG